MKFDVLTQAHLSFLFLGSNASAPLGVHWGEDPS
jgi:hypothetical protein